MSLRTTPFTVIHSSFPPTPSDYHHIIRERPNFISHTSGIIQIRIFTRTTHPFGFQVFVSPDALLHAGKGQDGEPSVYAWEEWGPPNTRWIKDPLSRLAPTIRPYGYRFGFADRVLDFNPCEVARDICYSISANSNNLTPWNLEGRSRGLLRPPPLHVENPKSRIVREPTVVSAGEVVRQEIVSWLPYRETSCVLEDMSQTALSYVDEDLYFVEVRPQPRSIAFAVLTPVVFWRFTETGPQRYAYVRYNLPSAVYTLS